MKNKFITIIIGILILLCGMGGAYADLTMCEKSEINRVCIENKTPVKIKVLMKAVKVYQRCNDEDREKNREKVMKLLKEILEVE